MRTSEGLEEYGRSRVEFRIENIGCNGREDLEKKFDWTDRKN